MYIQKERELLEINRQHEIKNNIYTFLLQKREESAIASSTAIGNYEQLEPAGGSTTPIEPNSQKNLLFALVIGLLIPVAIIYLKDLFDDNMKSYKILINNYNFLKNNITNSTLFEYITDKNLLLVKIYLSLPPPWHKKYRCCVEVDEV